MVRTQTEIHIKVEMRLKKAVFGHIWRVFSVGGSNHVFIRTCLANLKLEVSEWTRCNPSNIS